MPVLVPRPRGHGCDLRRLNDGLMILPCGSFGSCCSFTFRLNPPLSIDTAFSSSDCANFPALHPSRPRQTFRELVVT